MRATAFWLVLIGLLLGGCFRWYSNASVRTNGLPKAPAFYECPMHPSVTLDHPGTCPQCNMALVAVYSEGATPRANRISVSPQQEALIGLKYASAQWEMISESTRAVARVVLDDTKIAHVQTKLDCFVDEILVKTVGSEVRKGETLLTVYDSQSVPAQKEYLDALKIVTDAAAKEESSEQSPNAQNLLAAAQLRLELMGFTEPQLKTILTAMQPMVKLPIVSPINGVVVEVTAIPRQRVVPETLYTIVDLTTVWAIADLSSDASAVEAGQAATLRVPVLQGRTFPGVIDSILPSIDKVTHTRKVRVRIDNAGKTLLPEMYGDLEFRGRARRALVVPIGAVLDRGMHQTVFIADGHGHLEHREVMTGQKTEERIEIVKGLHSGDRVVSAGHFLIDSDSRLKSEMTNRYDQPGH